MSKFSQYLENLTAEWIRGTDFPSAPLSLQLALSTADPLDDGSGLAEPSGGSYIRQAITFNPAATTASGVQITSDSGIVFPIATVAYGVITHIAVFDSSGTNMLFFAPLAVSKSYNIGDPFSFAAGDISHTIKPKFSTYFATQIANWINGTTMPTAPANVQLALSTADPLADGSGLSEPPNTDGYQRQNITFGSPSAVVGTGTTLTSDISVVFGPANTNDWPSVDHGALIAGSDVLVFASLAVPKTAEIGDGIPFAIGSVSFTIK